MIEDVETTVAGISRTIELAGHRTVHEVPRGPGFDKDLSPVDMWDRAVLLGEVPRLKEGGGRGRVRIVDLFSGAGGLSLGVVRGLKAMGFDPIVELAADIDAAAVEIYQRNLGPADTFLGDIAKLVEAPISFVEGQASFDHKPWIRDRRLAARLSGVDVLVGGPPCQGHSNLNNRTRRLDPRNRLYLVMPAVAIALDIPVVIIENVREVRRDRMRVVEQTRLLLNSAGYSVFDGVVSGLELGLAQRRLRHFLVAVKLDKPRSGSGSLSPFVRPLQRAPRPLYWAISDLENKPLEGFHSPSRLSPENQRRIQFLFDNDQHDLPNPERPACHRNGHTYKSVYGRLRWEDPAGTITTGFLTPGRGRFIHPSQPRALTPHEGARIQGFPDSFDFRLKDGSYPPRSVLAKVIGDAVPPMMGEAIILAAFQIKWNTRGANLDEAA